MRKGGLVLALCALVGCSGDGSSPDGGGSGGAGGSDGGGGADGATSCTGTLAQATFCEANYTDQMAAYPCDDPNNQPTTRMCGGGSYKIWENLFIGSQTCVFNAAGTMLVGARTCDSTILDCPNNCVVYGIAESLYATCGADSPACP